MMSCIEEVKLFRILLNSVEDAVISTKVNGEIIFFNKAAQQMLGFPDNVRKLEWLEHFDLVRPDKKIRIDKNNHPIFRILRDEKVKHEEMFLVPKRKISRPVVVNGSILKSGTEKEGAILFIRDITKQKETETKLNRRSKSLMEAYEGLRKAEVHLKLNNADLEKRVMERTKRFMRINSELESEIKLRQRTEREIKKSNYELSKTNSDLDNFIYTASHDLKAPISNLEGLISALKDSVHSEDSEDSGMIFGLIEKSIDKFKQTISDLTEINKVQKGFDEELADISFQELLNDTIILINDIVISSDCKIITDFKEKNIRYSIKNLRSIFYNLISNAIKYRSLSRKPEIIIRTFREGKYLVLTFKDNGLGISPSNQEKIFKMFRRAHDHVEGAGTGLYIVKRMIENAEGKIEVESEENKGTTFKIYFLCR